MNLRILVATGVVATIWHTPVSAQMSVNDRLANMEKRMQYLEKRVVDQDKVIQEKDRQLQTLSQKPGMTEEEKSAWFQKVKLSGAVELEASHTDPFVGNATSDFVVATAEIGVEAQVHDWVEAQITLLHEEDDTNLEVDVARFKIAPPEAPWFLQGGQFYVPFGTYDSNMISSPLTLEIAETRETAAQVGFETNGFSGSAYTFNGTNKDGGDDRIDNFGLAVGYAKEAGDVTFSVNAGYINDIGDSDNLETTISANLGSNNVVDHVPAWAVSGVVQFGPISLMGEYLTAIDEFAANEVAFAGNGAKPSAWNIEAGYTFSVMDKETVFALAYQGTDEALAIGQPEQRYMVGLSMALTEYVGVGVEWAHDEDYSVAEGGTGNAADTVTAQLAIGF